MEGLGFQAGDEVELKGLSKVELNGQRGTILPLEYPEQAKILGRLAVMLSSGKQLSVKVDCLLKVAPLKPTGGDLGDHWKLSLQTRGKAMGLPLSCRLAAKVPQAQQTNLLLMCVNLRAHWSCIEPMEFWDLFQNKLSDGNAPDIICVQEALECSDLFMNFGYVKLVSNAVYAQTIFEAVHGDTEVLTHIPQQLHDKLVVNEIYIQAKGFKWEVIESGVDQLPSYQQNVERSQMAEQVLPVNAIVWTRLCPISHPEGPCTVVINACSVTEDSKNTAVPQTSATEQDSQIEGIMRLHRSKFAERDLGILAGWFATASSSTDSQITTKTKLQKAAMLLGGHGWKLAEECVEAKDTSSCDHCVCKIATSRAVPVLSERVSLSKASSEQSKLAGDVSPSELALMVKVVVQQEGWETQHQTGLNELPIVGFGTCFLPEDLKERVADKDYRRWVEELTEKAVSRALEVGVRLFDCSNTFINQKIVGQALRQAIDEGRVKRTELFICGRIWRCKDRAEARREVELMLDELLVDYVDLLTMDIPPERVHKCWPWVEEIHKEGRARYLGILNFDLLGPKVCVEVLREFLAKVEIPPSVHLMEVHAFNTNEEMCECCRGADIQVMAYSPVGAPHKIEAFMKVLTKSDARDMRPLLKITEHPIIKEIGKRHNVSAAQVALRWNLQRGHCVIPKSFDPGHVAENTELFHFSLTSDEMVILTGLHKGVRTERFFQQSSSSGKKALPRMTRDAYDDCEKILAKIRGQPVIEDEKPRGSADELQRRQSNFCQPMRTG